MSGATATRSHSQQRREFVDTDPDLSDDGTQGSLRHLVMIRDREASVWRIDVSQDNVASPLVIGFVSDASQGFDDIAPGDDGERAQIETSTISSEIDGGRGSE